LNGTRGAKALAGITASARASKARNRKRGDDANTGYQCGRDYWGD